MELSRNEGKDRPCTAHLFSDVIVFAVNKAMRRKPRFHASVDLRQPSLSITDVTTAKDRNRLSIAWKASETERVVLVMAAADEAEKEAWAKSLIGAVQAVQPSYAVAFKPKIRFVSRALPAALRFDLADSPDVLEDKRGRLLERIQVSKSARVGDENALRWVEAARLHPLCRFFFFMISD